METEKPLRRNLKFISNLTMSSKIHDLLKLWRLVYPFRIILKLLTDAYIVGISEQKQQYLLAINEIIGSCDPSLIQPPSKMAFKCFEKSVLDIGDNTALVCLAGIHERIGENMFQLISAAGRKKIRCLLNSTHNHLLSVRTSETIEKSEAGMISNTSW